MVAAVTRQTRAKASREREGKEEEERLVWSETDQAPEKTGVGIVSDQRVEGDPNTLDIGDVTGEI